MTKFQVVFFIAAQIGKVVKVNATQMGQAPWDVWAAIKKYSLSHRYIWKILYLGSANT